MNNAYHEAGHAVVAIRLGLQIKHVSLSECFLNLRQTDSLDSFLTTAAAGSVAAHIYDWTIPATIGGGDLAMVHRYKNTLTDLMADFYLCHPQWWPIRLAVASDKAADLLRANWRQVDILARELAQHGYIVGDEIAKIIER